MEIYLYILDWSEIWATLLPLFVFLFRRKRESYLLITVRYLVFAAVIYTVGDVWRQYYWELSGLLRSNNCLYNVHSFVRTACFIFFFKAAGLKQKWFHPKFIVSFFAICFLVIFLFFDNFFVINSKVFTIEGLLLLICCVSFFLQRLKDEEIDLDFDAPLIIVTGLTIYESVNFFVFLFFNTLMEKAYSVAGAIWDVHNWGYIIFSLFICYAFLGKTRIHHDLLGR